MEKKRRVLVIPDPKLTVAWSLNRSRQPGDAPAFPHSPGALLRARREALEGVARCFCSGSARGQRALATPGSLTPAQPLEALGAFLIDEELLDCEALQRDRLATIFDANTHLPCSETRPPEESYAEVVEAASEGGVPPAGPPFESWHLTKIGVQAAWAAKLTGKGVLVGLLDSGFVGKQLHPELADKTIHFQQFNQEGVPVSAVGLSEFHGAEVATVLAGRNLGVAPDCDLAVAGVIDADETHSTPAQFAAGLNWLLCHSFRRGHPPGVDLLSCSLGFDGCDPGLYELVRHARTLTGKLLLAMIGNEGEAGEGNVQSPGAYDGVVGVGGTDPSDNVAAFSDWGQACALPAASRERKPDLCAPGVDILTAGPGFALVRRSGTSFATPQVAGAAALLMQKDPSLRGNADALEAALFELVTPLEDTERGGRGRLDLTKIPAPQNPPGDDEGGERSGERVTSRTEVDLVPA